MPKRHIDPQIKEAALRFRSQHREDIDHIYETLRISRSTVNRVVNIYEESGDVLTHLKSAGRPRILDGAAINTICFLINRYPRIDVSSIYTILHAQGYDVTPSTVLRSMHRAGFTHKQVSMAAAERSAILRAAYIAMIAEYDVRQLVWLDETAKDDRTTIKKVGWSYSNNRARVEGPFSRGDRYNILPAMTWEGYIAMDIYMRPVNRATFLDFVEHSLLPVCNPFPGPRSVIVMDNCKIHKGEEVLELFDRAGCLPIYLPPYSPDLNPIEYSFGLLKQEMQREGVFETGRKDMQYLYELAGRVVTSSRCIGWIKYSAYDVSPLLE